VLAIRTVMADNDRVILGVSRQSLGHVHQEPPMASLSPREREVLALVGDALSNGQIASRLSLTEATVKRHLRNIFVKLGAVSRIDAVNKAAQWQPNSCRSVPSGPDQRWLTNHSRDARHRALHVGKRSARRLQISGGTRMSDAEAFISR
jgi:DNA-binding CsgD family transcriptional regulator